MRPKWILLFLIFSASVQANCGLHNIKKLNHVATPYQKAINKASQKYKVDKQLIYSVIAVESCFREKALSGKGAQGLMQLMPATAERFSGKTKLTSEENILAGTRYIQWLSKRFKGNLTLVLAAYNSGEGTVDKYSGVPPYKETRQYVKKVKKIHNKLKKNSPPQQTYVYEYGDELLKRVEANKKKKRQTLCHLEGQLNTGHSLSQYLECVKPI